MPAKKAKKPQQKDASSTPRGSRRPVNARLRKLRWPILAVLLLVVSLLMLLATMMQLFNLIDVDDYLEETLITHVDTKLDKTFDKRDIAIVLVDENQQSKPPFGKADSTHRQYHAELINALSRARARVLFFDLWFDTESTFDQNLAVAAQQAEQSGTKVLFGLNPEGAGEPFIPGALKSLPKDCWGIIEGGMTQGKSNVRRIQLAQELDEGSASGNRERAVVPALTLKAVQQFSYRDQPVGYYFNPWSDQIRLRDAQGQIRESIPVNSEMYFVVDLIGRKDSSGINLYHDVYAERNNDDYMSRFRNKIVFIGYEAGDEHDTPNGKRYGAEILANAVSNILQHNYVRSPPLLNHYLIILIMIVIGTLLPLWFGAWMIYTLPLKMPIFSDARIPVPVPMIAVTLVYIFIAIMVYKVQRTVLNTSYHIAALFLAYLVTSTIRTRLGFK